MPISKRVLYFCPDYPQPSGGTKTLYRHVHRLQAAGVDAAIVHQKRGFQLDWHIYPAPVIWLEDRPRFNPDDILVFPEVMTDMIRQTAGFAGRRVVISLSWLPSYARLQPGERWQDLGITHILTTSPAVQRHVSWSMQIDVTLVPAFVDPGLYTHEPSVKTKRVAYLTRKDGSADWLRGVLERRGAAPPEYAWTPLRNLEERAYAAALRQSSVFVTTTLQEGLHVSVLEAMACGCLVIGYAAVGGADHMVAKQPDQNCLPVRNGDLLQLGRTVESALCELSSDPGTYDNIIANATASAKRYQDATVEAEALIAFYGNLGD